MSKVDPSAFGLPIAKTAALGGADPAANAVLTEGVLRGEPGARRDVVLLNAGAALVAAGSVESIVDGIERAALIDRRRARRWSCWASCATSGACPTRRRRRPKRRPRPIAPAPEGAPA